MERGERWRRKVVRPEIWIMRRLCYFLLVFWQLAAPSEMNILRHLSHYPLSRGSANGWRGSGGRGRWVDWRQERLSLQRNSFFFLALFLGWEWNSLVPHYQEPGTANTPISNIGQTLTRNVWKYQVGQKQKLFSTLSNNY